MKTVILTFLAASAIWLCSAKGDDFSDYPVVKDPKAVPARAVQIEKFLGVEFVAVQRFGQEVRTYWVFRLSDNSTPLGWMYFLIPANATDIQAHDCIYSAIFCYGVTVTGLKKMFQEYLERQAKPTDKTGIIYQ